MTDFGKQAILGPIISPLVSKDKGDFSNRTNCAGAQLMNNVKTLAQDVVVLDGTAVGAKAATNGGKFAKIMAKPIDFMIKLGKKAGIKLPKDRKFLKAFAKFKGDTVTKAIVALGTLGIAAVSYIHRKHLYKMGQIDQKYTDKAKVEQHQKNVLD